MILRVVFVALSLNFCSFSIGQIDLASDEFTDNRDGRKYQTITLGNTVWLTENMKLKTENSDISGANDFGIKEDEFYYPYEEVNEVCPENFRIPRHSDWEAYLQHLIELKNIPESSIKSFTTNRRRVSGIAISVADSTLQIFDDPNPLKLEMSGMIQGGTLISDQALTFWSRKDGSDDHKYHLHITANGYGNHTHKHHVISRKKKKRKFTVRCVRDITTDQ